MTDLPDSDDVIASFKNPPVVEVVAAVKFSGLSEASFLSVGTFWQERMRELFPKMEIQAPYDAPIERFDRPMIRPSVEFGPISVPPLPRVWLTSEQGSELVQVQRDWFAANWRKSPGPSTTREPTVYDRWSRRRNAFLENWRLLVDWAAERGEDLTPLQCEVTYINHIRPIPGVWDRHADAAEAFSGIAMRPPAGYQAEQFSWRGQFRLPSVDGYPQARVHASVEPAFAGDGPIPDPIVVFQITARSAPAGETESDVLRTLDRARAGVVQSFVQLTSDEARAAWGQK